LSFAENSRPMTMNAEVYKTFDRSTPAGRALWALYNASDKSAAKVGNGYSAKNGAAVAAQRQRMTEDPEFAERVMERQRPAAPPPRVVAGEKTGAAVRVPKMGRRAGGGSSYTYVPRPGRRPAAQMQQENRHLADEERRSMEFEASRLAAVGGDRAQAIADLQQANMLHGSDLSQLAKQVMADDDQRMDAEGVAEKAGEFETLLAEVDERQQFLAEMRALGKAGDYEAAIKRELSTRLSRLKVLDQQRKAEGR